MKPLALRFLVAILTFSLGTTIFRLTPQKYAVAPAETLQPANIDTVTVTKSNTKTERFKLLGHACGNGWAEGFELPDGQRLSTGLDPFDSAKKTESAVAKFLSKAARIISVVENYKKPNGKAGKRIVAELISEKSGEKFVSIIFQPKGKNHYEYIDAPTLEIALEFEQYQGEN